MSQLKNVEARILQCLQNNFLARYVSLPNHNKIWTVTVSPELRDRTPLVMVHGFGGGVGLWILNMDSLSARRTLHTFDLLGFGRSSRPAFPRDPEGAEDEFVTSIETWRETLGIPSMILLGHSLGGFLATSYSIKYPERVKHLILVDPWGFPLRPADPSEIRAPPTWLKAVASVLGRSNPLAVLRVAGPWGPGLVQRFRPDFKRKFADFFEDDTISEYIYHCNAQNPRRLRVLHTTSMQISHTSSMLWWKRSATPLIELLSQEEEEKARESLSPPCLLTHLSVLSSPTNICQPGRVLGCPQGGTRVKKSTPDPALRARGRSHKRP
ncbi:(Lyso)-N-acylphosphatidylethanolamine lipase isoform X3 [Diceros bicornis minor]|nr:(Lyso)-N-acylphosphatidylethanolamine lipase isoform X3 [Diceros bicornis minor]XP_058396979.1 (Lyso)-N-acylphosphatidylethanolamine lipase isoform X3 [Diceros bicornis minor]